MKSKRMGMVPKVFFLVFVFTLLAGCSAVDFPPKMEFSSTWVSKDGTKSRDQLYEDQKECTHEAMLVSSPPFPGEMRAAGAGDMKVFDRCMRAKGWVKE